MSAIEEFWPAVAIARTLRAWESCLPLGLACLPPCGTLLRAIDTKRRAEDPHERLAAVEVMHSLHLPGLDDWLAKAASDPDTEVRSLASAGPETRRSPSHDRGLALADPDRDATTWGLAVLQHLETDTSRALARIADGLASRTSMIRELAVVLLDAIPLTLCDAWRWGRRRFAEKAALDTSSGSLDMPASRWLIRQAAARLVDCDGALQERMLSVLLSSPDVLQRTPVSSLLGTEWSQILDILRARRCPENVLQAFDSQRVRAEMLERLPAERLAEYVELPVPMVAEPARSAALAAIRRLMTSLVRMSLPGSETSASVPTEEDPLADEPPAMSAADAVAGISSGSPWDRARSAWALATVTTPEASQTLYRHLGETHELVRTAIVHALAATPRPEALSALEARAQDSREVVRKAVAEVFAGWAIPQCTPTLRSLCADPACQEAAIAGLARLIVRGRLSPTDVTQAAAAVVAWRNRVMTS